VFFREESLTVFCLFFLVIISTTFSRALAVFPAGAAKLREKQPTTTIGTRMKKLLSRSMRSMFERVGPPSAFKSFASVVITKAPIAIGTKAGSKQPFRPNTWPASKCWRMFAPTVTKHSAATM